MNNLRFVLPNIIQKSKDFHNYDDGNCISYKYFNNLCKLNPKGVSAYYDSIKVSIKLDSD